jgi:hypothetical protein
MLERFKKLGKFSLKNQPVQVKKLKKHPLLMDALYKMFAFLSLWCCRFR